MWEARTKTDLVIEVWEKLDCEDVGAAEIEAIDVAVRDQFGKQAVDSPMKTARLLADEGAILRHSEVMGLFLARAADRPYDAAFRNVIDLSGLTPAIASIRSLNSLRNRYMEVGDQEGLRIVRESAIEAKKIAEETASRPRVDPASRLIAGEIADWFRIWLQTPGMFDHWIELRMASHDFTEKFGKRSG